MPATPFCFKGTGGRERLPDQLRKDHFLFVYLFRSFAAQIMQEMASCSLGSAYPGASSDATELEIPAEGMVPQPKVPSMVFLSLIT